MDVFEETEPTEDTVSGSTTHIHANPKIEMKRIGAQTETTKPKKKVRSQKIS